MRMLLLGARGFLGSHVQRAASAAGWEVITAGRQPRGPAQRHITIDLTAAGPAGIGAVLTDVAPEAVVNCAGATSGEFPALAAANIDVPATLVRAMLLTRSAARLVHLGSAGEYGRGERGVPVREDSPARPVSGYGATKLGGTLAVAVARAAGLPAVVLRVFNPVGAGAPASSLSGRAAAEIARASAQGDCVRLGNLDAVRDFVDATDMAHAALAAATTPTPHPVLNIGSGQAVSARELVHTLLKVSGLSPEIQESEPGSPRSTDVPWQQADISAARAALGWSPRTPLSCSLTNVWRALP
ncbi:MAG TPA: NAD-dependent epimerase/dehydratase family protein [Pseudonocardiaceae bacterium]|nr:NAD-dependent epimerase/dehydratase family protein [Pseudonocardiaceae bacterium]